MSISGSSGRHQLELDRFGRDDADRVADGDAVEALLVLIDGHHYHAVVRVVDREWSCSRDSPAVRAR